jgi:16S rRNA (guanine966-N2)-methyltransferase
MPHKQNQLRIIGGKWRSRLIKFPEVADIRPTPNRVRETLFNWLQASVADAHCLDLFAGSGALGFEALSRDAASLTFVDNHAEVVTHLETQGEILQAENFDIKCMNALAWLSRPAVKTFDIVFLDPPFTNSLVTDCLTALLENHWLAPGALIYIEQSTPLEALNLPSGLTLGQHKKAGDVYYGLLRFDENQ